MYIKCLLIELIQRKNKTENEDPIKTFAFGLIESKC